MSLHPTYVEDIEHLDFDVPCVRCRAQKGELVVGLSTLHGCRYDGWRGLVCSSCATASGPCHACQKQDSYKVLS